MKLREDVEAIIQILNNSAMSPFLFQDNGSVISKNDIEHFIVVHARNTDLYDEECRKLNSTKKPIKRRKKQVEEDEIEKYAEMEEKSIEEEENVGKDEQNVNLTDDEVYHLIAKQRKINIASTTILSDNNWFICPVFKGMDGLYPLSFKRDNDRKSYRVIVTSIPIFRINPNTFNDDNLKDWELNSMFMFNSLFEQNSANILGLTAQTIFVHKKSSQLNYLIKKAMDRLKVTQRARIKLGNILIDEVLTYVGQEAYIVNKENIAKAIKRSTDKSDKGKEVTKYDVDDVKIIDQIEESFKKINNVAKEMGKTVPINRESTFNNILNILTQQEEEQHKLQAAKYQEEENVSFEEAYEATKTLRSKDYIPSIITYTNTLTYMNMVKAEDASNTTLEKLVKQHELWPYFEGIKGVAHVSAGAILADIDFRSTVHPSSVIRYLGLDNITATPNREENEEMSEMDAARIIRYLVNDCNNICHRNNQYQTLGIPKLDKNDIYTWEHFYKTDVIKTLDMFELIKKVYVYITLHNDLDVNKLFAEYPKLKDIVTNIWNTVEIIDMVTAEGKTVPTIKKRSRQKYDTIVTTYLDKNGKIKTKKSLGYNSELKAKLLQVMFDCMIKHSSPYYIKEVYRPYRHRLEQRFKMQGLDPESKGCKDKIFKMARRFTIQRFVEDLWKYVRNYYNWPLNGGTYYEAKLAGSHRHGLNPAVNK